MIVAFPFIEAEVVFKADARIRTADLLITSELLYH
jgi:hypothetical protein